MPEPSAVDIEAPVSVAAIGRQQAGKGKRRPAVADEEKHARGGQHEVGVEREQPDVGDDGCVVRETDRKEGKQFGFLSVREPRHESGPGEQQQTVQSPAADDPQGPNVMRGVSGEVNGRQAAGEDHLRVIFQRLLLAGEPRAQAQQQAAAQIHQEHFARRAKFNDKILVGVVAKEDQRGEQHNDADAHEPNLAELHFERRLSGRRRRCSGIHWWRVGWGSNRRTFCRCKRRFDLRCGTLARKHRSRLWSDNGG